MRTHHIYAALLGACMALMALTRSVQAVPTQIGDAGLGGTGTDSAGSRLNIELTSVALSAGKFNVIEIQSDTVGDGDVIPILLKRNGADNGYEVLWSGGDLAVTGTGNTTWNFSPGDEEFELSVGTDVFAGMHHDGAAKVRFLNGGSVDHDGTPPATFNVGDNISDASISNSGLGRTYMFEITVDAAPAVPEPATGALGLMGLGALGAGLRRRRA